jgi:hypothetical protein
MTTIVPKISKPELLRRISKLFDYYHAMGWEEREGEESKSSYEERQRHTRELHSAIDRIFSNMNYMVLTDETCQEILDAEISGEPIQEYERN